MILSLRLWRDACLRDLVLPRQPADVSTFMVHPSENPVAQATKRAFTAGIETSSAITFAWAKASQ